VTCPPQVPRSARQAPCRSALKTSASVSGWRVLLPPGLALPSTDAEAPVKSERRSGLPASSARPMPSLRRPDTLVI
jgi:hypothetical protein